MKTQDEIIESAERLLQEKGWNGWSYADISEEIGIKKASIHYHFKNKEALGLALIQGYQRKIFEELKKIQLSKETTHHKLEQFFQIFENVLRGHNLFCLCGMLVADFYTLSPEMRQVLLHFFDDLEGWLSSLLREGLEKKELSCEEDVKAQAKFIIGSLEGLLLLTRIRPDQREEFKEISQFLLKKYRL